MGRCGKNPLSSPDKWSQVRLLFGNYELTIDDKNRLLVPAEIRRAIDPVEDGNAFFIVTGTNKRLWMYPDKYYENMVLGLQSDIVPEEELLEFDQMHFGLASRAELDRQGRVLIPERTLRKAGLSKDITLVGVRDHIEVWSRNEWNARVEELCQRRSEIALRAKQRHLGSHVNRAQRDTHSESPRTAE